MLRTIILLLLSSTLSHGQQRIIKYWTLGNKTVKVSNEKALPLYRRALQEAEKDNNFHWQANILTDISGAYFGLRKYKEGSKCCLKGLEICKKYDITTDSISFKLHSALAANYKNLYEPEMARKEYEIANKILENNVELESQIPLYVAYHYSNQGVFWNTLYDYRRAKSFYEKALKVATKCDSQGDIILISNKLSNLYLYSGEYEKGINLLTRAIKNYKFLPKKNDLELVKMYTSLAGLYEGEKKALAIDSYKDCIAICNKYNSAKFSNYHRNALLRISELTDNLIYSGNIISQLNQNPEDYALLKSKANYTRKIGKYREAIEVLKGSIKDVSKKKSISDRIKVFSIYDLLSTVYFENFKINREYGSLDSSLLYKDLSISLNKELRLSHATVESQIFSTSKFYYQYLEKLQILKPLIMDNPVYIEEYFKTSEEGKSISLTNRGFLNSNFRNNSTDSLLFVLNAYQSYVSQISKLASTEVGSVNDLEIKISAIIREIEASNPGLSAEKNSFDKVVNLREYQDSMEPDMLYLSYVLLSDEVQILAISKWETKVSFHKLDGAQFAKKLNELSASLRTPPSRFEGYLGTEASKYLYEILIDQSPIDIHDFRRVVINPSRELYDISFDVLVNKSSGKYLIQETALSYSNNLEAAVLNEKLNNKIDFKWNALFPFEDSSQKLLKGLRPLNFSFKKVKGVKADFYKNEQANKKLFLDKLQNESNKVLMIASHASSDGGDPYLIFDTKNTPESKLYASEMQFMKTVAPFVVLGACETANGEKIDGLGMMSFSQALTLSGCNAIGGSFWEVEDQSMSVLTSLFYRNIMKGLSKDIALQQAKLDYLETEIGKRNDSPFYWAHFQIMGDTQPIVQRYNKTLMIVFGVFFLENIFSPNPSFDFPFVPKTYAVFGVL